MQAVFRNLRRYISLTKPTIVVSFALTGATGLIMAGSLSGRGGLFLPVLLAIFLTGASANGLNQYFERDLDAKMERTRKKRPLPKGEIRPRNALFFSVTLGIAGVVLLLIYANILSAAYALGTILFYSFYYTLWLKPRTPYNIVIGGAAGATAPLIAWAAVSGSTPSIAWVLFWIIFMWTPPHFWALALCVKDQYARVGIPMLPVVKGEVRTRNEIFVYSVLLLVLSLVPFFMRISGGLYLLGAAILGLLFVAGAWRVKTAKTTKAAGALFGYSILYLLLLFILLIVDYLA